MTDLASSCVLGHVWGKLADRTHIELDQQIMFKINTRNHLTKYHSWLLSYRVAFGVVYTKIVCWIIQLGYVPCFWNFSKM